MKVLFYLPVVTSWWFAHIVEPLIRRVASVAEVHVLAPSPWRKTGLGPRDLQRCFDLDDVYWHIVDSDDHPSLRTNVADRDGLLTFVRHLAPDIVLCRAADFETVSHFPGVVRFLMEVAAGPFDVAACTTMITERPFANGIMPELSPSQRMRLEALFDPLWTEMQTHWHRAIPDRETVLGEVNIPQDLPILLLPLEYENEENFFLQHRVPQQSNCALLTGLANTVTAYCSVLLTDHPLNTLYVDRTELREKVLHLGPRVILAGSKILGFPTTLAVARHVDGVLLGDSKAFCTAACFGAPMQRRSRFATADWLNTEIDLKRFITAIQEGHAQRPSESDTRLWLAFHLADEAFNPQDDGLTGAEIIDRVLHPVNPNRWQAGLARVRAVKQEYLH